jgi:hypothetical protein
LESLNTQESPNFDPTVFLFWETKDLNPTVKAILQPYITWTQKVVRHPTDIVMVTHLILYCTTSIPSAIYLFNNFTWLHGLVHWIIQTYYVGTYTLMKHQHIHMGGILARRLPYSLLDTVFPYMIDPLFGHTWNSYYYHHVKHHHVEGNGPDDLSSTIRYQRDDIFNLLHYIGRFYFFIWLDLPFYFIRKKKYAQAFNTSAWEISNYAAIYVLAKWQFLPTFFVFILPLLLLRLGLMIGNWGQHAFVDEVEPDSDFRSSITLIDVAVSHYPSNPLLTITHS